MEVKKTKRTFPGGPGPGRPKGIPNKATGLLKDAILQAAALAGGKEGLVGYLTAQAKEEPVAFMGMLGKVMPLQIVGEGDGPLRVEIVRFGNNPDSK
jgi:hypothetical protein